MIICIRANHEKIIMKDDTFVQKICLDFNHQSVRLLTSKPFLKGFSIGYAWEIFEVPIFQLVAPIEALFIQTFDKLHNDIKICFYQKLLKKLQL